MANQQNLHFGMGDYVQLLSDYLIEHLYNDERRQQTRVIGVYGQWGSGKTTLLESVEEDLHTVLAYSLAALQETGHASGTDDWMESTTVSRDKDGFMTNAQANRLIVPVFFNPWRYENEEHLIVPLIKTLEATLKKATPNSTGEPGDLASWFKTQVMLASTAALSLVMGLGVSAGAAYAGWAVIKSLSNQTEGSDEYQKFVQDLVKDGAKKTVEGLGEKSDPKALATSPVENLQSVYYDLLHYLEILTKPSEDGTYPTLNIVFLIDDLDRCMPEKALQMLESIKLFLEVPGCAFMLAVDDQVVERGVMHRYRDYIQPMHTRRHEEEGFNSADTLPITGMEYLEKIIHLPIHIPGLTKDDVKVFLTENYADLFVRPSAPVKENELGKAKTNADSKEQLEYAGVEVSETLSVEQQDDVENQKRRAVQDSWGIGEDVEDLLTLFLQAVPYVPRKLIRAAELLEFTLKLAARKGIANGLDSVTLTRVLLLQLFAPDIFRFGKQGTAQRLLNEGEASHGEG